VELDDWQIWWEHNGARELRDLLLLWWDPIGVYGVPEARDEYDDYLEPIGAKLREGAGRAELAAYLAELSEERMGLPPDPERSDQAAGKVIEWLEQATKQRGRWRSAP
jgi:hypothetical protein